MNPGTKRDPFLRAHYLLTRGLIVVRRFLGKGKIKHDERKALKERRMEDAARWAVLEKKYSDLQEGVSVIIGTYKGEKVIDRCLDSLVSQTLDHSRFEMLFIINGERDRTDQKIKSIFAGHPTINYSVHYTEKASLGAARNFGFKKAKRRFACFLDDDDYLSENYLKEMLALCDDHTVVLSQVVDVDEDGNLNPGNPVNNEIVKYRKVRSTQMMRLKRGISMSGGKMFPTVLVKEHEIREELKSGEDIVFFTELFTTWDLTFRIVPPSRKAIYYRLLRTDSMSRRKLSYNFNVTERIAVLTYLEKQYARVKSPYKVEYILMRIKAQAGFIRDYLEKYNDERDRVCQDIVKAGLVHFPFELLNYGKARKLVISYCFPPYVDTSGTVVAKRIRAAGEVVDVIHNNMETRRDVSENLLLLAGAFIDRKIELATPTTFSNWKGINEFIKHGLKAIQFQTGYKGHYEKVYSRAMWPASHLLAYAYKSWNSDTEWTAEFSDPVMFDIHGEERRSNITDHNYLQKIKKDLNKINAPVPDSKNLFFWCEYLPYAFADRIVFTNENQRRYMLDRFPVSEIRSLVMKKSLISHHPMLPEMFYHIQESDYMVDPRLVNLAYFGVFYQTRKLDELIEAVRQLDKRQREKLMIHVFTDNPAVFNDEIKDTLLEEVFCAGPYVDYFEFLNLCTRFDCLVVNDARTNHVKEINPYLPSKLSDYLGSGVPVWALYEEGSILSEHPVEYKSPIGDVPETLKMLNRIIGDKVEKKK